MINIELEIVRLKILKSDTFDSERQMDNKE